MTRSFTALAVTIVLAVALYPADRADAKECYASTNNPAVHAFAHSNQYDRAFVGPTNQYGYFCARCTDLIGGAVSITQSEWTAWCTNGCGTTYNGPLAFQIAQWTVAVTNVAEDGAINVASAFYSPEELKHEYGDGLPGTNYLFAVFTNAYDHGKRCPLHGEYEDGDPRSPCYANLAREPWDKKSFCMQFEGEASVKILSCGRERKNSNESVREIPAGGLFQVSIDGVRPSGFTNVAWEVVSTNKNISITCVSNNGLQATFKVEKTSGHGEACVWARLPVGCGASCRESDEPCWACERKVTIKVGCACNACEEGAGQCLLTAGTSATPGAGRNVDITMNLGSLRGEQVGFLDLALRTPAADMAARKRLSAIINPGTGCAVQHDGQGALQQISGPQILCSIEDLESSGQTGFRASFRDPATPEGVPYLKWEVQAIAENQVAVTKYEDNTRKTVTLYAYDAVDGMWDMSQTDGEGQALQQSQYDKQVIASDLAVETETSMDPPTGIITVSRQSVRTLADGTRLVLTNETGFGGAWTTTIYEHFVDGEIPEGSWGRLKSERREPEGDWTRYEYDEIGRPSKSVRPWKNAAFGAVENACRVTTYDYTPLDAGDAVNPGAVRTVVEWVLGTPVSRTCTAYRPQAGGNVKEETTRCSDPTPGQAVAGETTTTIRYGDNAPHADLKNRPIQVQSPDGRLDLYQYEQGDWNGSAFAPRAGGLAWRESVTHATAGAPDGVLGRSTREVSVTDANGHAVYEEQQVLSSSGSWGTAGWSRTEIDSLGRPTVVHHANGMSDERVWGCCGVRSQISTDGTQTLFEHDGRGRIVGETKAGIVGQVPDILTRKTLDSKGRVLVQTTSSEGLSMTTSNRFDVLDRQVWQADSQGRVFEWGYHVSGLIETNTLPGGATVITERHADGQTKSVTGTGTTARHYDYGVNADGTRWTCVYTGPDGLASPMWEKTTADALGHTVREERPGFGGVVVAQVNTYDAAGRLAKTTLVNAGTGAPLRAPTLYAYDEFGDQALSAVDANGNDAIDVAGPDTVTSNDTLYVQVGNDWFRQTESFAFPRNSPTPTRASATLEQLTGLGVASAEGVLASRTLSYNARGNETASATYVDRNAKRTTVVVDVPESNSNLVSLTVNGLLTLQSSKTDTWTAFGYDALGRQVSATDSRTGASWSHYNAKGQVDWVMDAASNKTWFGYDPASGLRVAVTNAALEVTRTAYDLQGNVTNATGATYPVGYDYDAWGRMVSMTTLRDENGPGDTTRWKYDLATGLLTNKVYADGKGPAYVYDAAGQLAGRTWARGVTTAYRYAFDGALTNIDYSDATPDVVFEYDRMGRQTRAIAVGIATNVFTYNPTVLAMTNEAVSTRFEAGTRRIRRFYGMNDRPTELGLGSDYVVRYGYGSWGRQDELTFGVGPATSKVAYAYVKNSELLQSRVPTNGPAFRPAYEPARDLISWVTNRFGGTVVSRFAYENDAVGRRTKRVDSGAVTNVFGYNGRSELIEALMGADRYSYRFDPIGNRVVATNAGEAFGYTANVLNQYTSIVDGGTVTPSYDDDGNLTGFGSWTYVWDAENRLAVATDGSVSVTNVYDYMSRRIAKATATGARSFLYDGWNPIREVALAGGTLSTNFYVWGPDLSGTLQGAGGVGGLVAVIRDGAPYFTAYDANGNVTEYVSASGTVAAHYEYDPFGNTTVATGALVTEFAQRFSTKYWDPETGLYYYGYRFYSPSLGRWLSRDSISERGGRNLMAFIRNSAVNRHDVIGMFPSDSDILDAVIEGDDYQGCCYIHLIRSTLERDTALMSKLRRAYQSQRPGTRSRQKCLATIKCAKKCPSQPDHCDKCRETVQGEYKLSRDGMTGGAITLCPKGNSGQDPSFYLRALRHELQHAVQCGKYTSCQPGHESREGLGDAIRSELEARMCGDIGTGSKCDPALLRADPSRFKECVREEFYNIVGDPADFGHASLFCRKAAVWGLDPSGEFNMGVLQQNIGHLDLQELLGNCR